MSLSDKISHGIITKSKRPGILIFSLFAFCLLSISITFFALSVDKAYMGIMLSVDKQSWVVQSVDSNGLATQYGISVGNKPIEINGQPAQMFLEKYEKDGVVFGMLITEITVIDDRGQLKSVTLEGASPSLESVAELTTLFIVSLIFWVTGFFVLFKRPKNVAALLLCLSSLAFGLAISANIASERALPTALELEIIAAVIGPWLLLHFFLSLPEERASLYKNPLIYLIYIPAVVTLVLFFMIGYADGQPLPWFRTIRLLEYGAGFLAATVVAVLNYFLAASTRTRQQMKIVLISCLTAFIPFLILSILPAAIWSQEIIPSGFNLLFLAFVPIGMGYAVVTQKLMDIDVIIRRGVIYSLITVVMAAILSAAIIPIVTLHKSIGIPQQIIFVLVLGGIASVLFGPVKNGIEILVDRFFYRDRYDYRQILQSLSASLNSVKDFVGIARVIVGTTVHTLNLAGGCLFTKSQSGSFEVSASQGTFANSQKQKELATTISQGTNNIEFPNSASTICSDLAFLIPIMVSDRKVGILCLSQKASRQDFSSNDMYLLQGLASIAAMALHSAMLTRDVSVRDTFVSIASHELRTPLTSIMGYAELLLRRDPPEANRKRWLSNIFDNSQKISNIVDDLLNVSRIQTGRIAIKLEQVKVSDVLEDVLPIVKESSSKHKFVVEIDPDLPDVLADRDKLSQVVVNLLSNAVKYSPDGGRILISAHDSPQRHCAIVSIADEGIGISSADQESLFTTFHRIQRPETQGIRGSGLGLYIAKEWTEAMGGEIWFESELNKGSTFFVAIRTNNSNNDG